MLLSIESTAFRGSTPIHTVSRNHAKTDDERIIQFLVPLSSETPIAILLSFDL